MKRIDCGPFRSGLSLAVAALLAASGGASAAAPGAAGLSAQAAFGHPIAGAAVRQRAPALNLCNQVASTYTLSASPMTITFPTDCLSSGFSKLPGVDDGTLESPPQTMTVCENLLPITATGGCTNQPSVSDSPCSNASGTIFYSTLYINGQPGTSTAFAKFKIPLVFTSPLLLSVGAVYGLCVLADGLTVQDDFATGQTVSASGIPGTIRLHLLVPKISRGLYIFPNDVPASIFIQQKLTL